MEVETAVSVFVDGVRRRSPSFNYRPKDTVLLNLGQCIHMLNRLAKLLEKLRRNLSKSLWPTQRRWIILGTVGSYKIS